MQKKVTIYHICDARGVDYYWCCTKKHRYLKDSLSAARCCNGWTPVIAPRYYERSSPEYWGRWYEPESTGSRRILIPDFLTDEIARLRAVWGGVDRMKRTTWDWEQSDIEQEQ
jgi:hypothetical protein